MQYISTYLCCMNIIESILTVLPKSLFELGWKYILPVSALFLFFTFWKGFLWKKNVIQSRQVKSKFLMHEIKWWSVTMIFALLFVVIGYTFIELGISQVYADPTAFGLWYIPVSFVLLLLIHDTYFYWVHKLIHHKKVYRAIHRVHHYSPNPTPFDGFAVTPIEAIAELAFLPVLALIMPMYIGVYITFGAFYIFFNSYLHLGYEVLPKFWVHTPLIKYINTAVHHDQHHSVIRYNFGLYFNVWDRIMGTLHPQYEELYDQVKNGEKFEERLQKQNKMKAQSA